MNLIRKTIQLSALCLLISVTSCKEKYPELEDGLYAEIITNQGTMVIDLAYKEAPITVANFVSLAEGTNTMVDSAYKGKKYYNGLQFHRIIDEFMIQGGDPLGTGSGGPGYKFTNEITELKHDTIGTISMANSGPNTNGSQFFITEKATPFLDGGYNVFGYLKLGEDVLHTLAEVETTKPGDKPVNPVIMEEVNIIRKGSDAKNFDAPKVFEEHFAIAEKEEKERLEKMEADRLKMEETIASASKETKTKLDEYTEKAKTLPSGLKVYYLKKGDGPKPKQGDFVKMSYEGYYTDGRLFDSSKKEVVERYGMPIDPRREEAGMYGPMRMEISPEAQMIAGFKEAAAMMRVGDEIFFYMPSHLAYGERGRNPIPPNTDLTFIMEMTDIAE